MQAGYVLIKWKLITDVCVVVTLDLYCIIIFLSVSVRLVGRVIRYVGRELR